MSFLKKVGRRLGVNRKGPAEASADANVPVPLQQGISALAERNTRGTHDMVSPRAISDVRSQTTSQSSQQDKEHLNREGNQISISGGTFNSVGRDLIDNSQTHQTHIHNQYITEDSRDSKLFEVLNPVPAAHDCEVVSSKVSECFVGTRKQLLHDIETWRTTGSVPIFILDGIAGIGKSTIVKTVCAQADAERCLAASWFFSRDEQDRKTTRGFVRTLAYQLASYHPTLRDRISQVLKAQPDILQKAIRVQFEALIHEPLRDVLKNQSETHTISIDAIDECNLTEAVELLSILLTSIPQHPSLRLLVTCRPERPFRLLLQKHHGPRVFRLHEIENSVVEADIRLYINHCLSPAQIDEALPDLLPPPWRASHEEKEALVQMAGKLFIVASTAIRFILDPLRLAPAKQMAQLLNVKAGGGLAGSSMDRLYIQVLRAAVPEPAGDWFEDYQAVVGSIVVAADVLSTQSLASLLGMEPNDIVRTLSHLHSLIAPTRDSDAFHIHHKSFPDFVTDTSRCAVDSRFFIEASARHMHLAQNCLRIMNQMLKQNVCELPRSDWDVEASKLPSGTKDRIPPELVYACSHWILHIQEGLPHLIERGDVVSQLTILMDQHILSWLEVLAWTNRFDTAWRDVSLLSESIAQLPRITGGETLNPSLSHVVDVLLDLLRFISLHPEVPRYLPMHIYLSVLPFAPKESRIWDLYVKLAPNSTRSITVISGLEKHWDPISVTLKESEPVQAMDLSLCGTMVASRSGHVRLYNAKSGQLLQSLGSKEQDFAPYYCVAFSPDSRRLAASSLDGIQVWDVISGELVGSCPFPLSTPLFNNSSPMVVMPLIRSGPGSYTIWNPNTLQATSLIFHPDGLSIIAGTVDGRILLCQIGQPDAVLLPVDRSLNHPCNCLPEETRMGCGAHGVTILVALLGVPLVGVTQSAVHFWDQITLTHLTVIPRCATASSADPVSVSSDKMMMAIECDPCIISIHSILTQHHLCGLSGHQGKVTTTAFAPPSLSRQTQLCSASEDRTVRLWDIATASQLTSIQTVYVFMDTLFSAELDTFVLAEWEKRGQMVRLVGDQCITYGPSQFRGKTLNGLKLSADGSILASFHGTSHSIMVANVCDFVEPAMHTGTLKISQPFQCGYLPSGEVVALYWADELESPLTFSAGTTSLNVTIRKRCTVTLPSPDLSRLAIIEDNSATTLWICNLCSRRQEAGLQLPPLDPEYERQIWESDVVRFSWDSSTVYLQRPDNKFYAALLPSVIANLNDISFPQPTFSEIGDVPTPHFKWLAATGLPHASQLNFLAEDCAWVLLSDKKNWSQVHLPSLRFNDIDKITYSPSGELIAIAVLQGTGGSIAGTMGIFIQVRSLPDYDLIATVREHENRYGIGELRFINHLPHILVVSSPDSFTCWDATTGQSLGSSYSLFHPGSFESVHPYNGLDFLCLMKSRSALLVLVAIQLQGPDLGVFAQPLGFFPPHLSVSSEIHVNPCRPHIVALSTRNGIIELDISKCPLPFTL
ncbi:WD40-repeat-containing domain protein [Coprinopsis sp. MPI-PUGE-AT-0042]|nr:WD40-repeat-containing domain protein [Coprinopsis sp. MPI-PUGE-AT-0042]